ncbi:ribonuclease P protein subunit rpr2-like [Aricia agestis]|uniref:ribonuclease P protein subunit rpr2-like n=1 Tax=Aricia agestis TaxID=91739 RepID=UPI001C205763|nr:ribonuclease P protein subunit rpr2-like [Aricia agestis]
MRKVQGNDTFQRINFLYQLSKEVVEKNPALSVYYDNLVINIAKKSVLKIHPDIKRQICKKCRCMLVDKKSSEIKLKTKNKLKFISLKCTVCGYERRFPADKNKDHRVWLEKPEAVVEIIT